MTLVKKFTEFDALRTKMYAYKKIDNKLEDECWKDNRKCAVLYFW